MNTCVYIHICMYMLYVYTPYIYMYIYIHYVYGECSGSIPISPTNYPQGEGISDRLVVRAWDFFKYKTVLRCIVGGLRL